MNTAASSPTAAPQQRILALDQLRGYAIAGMMLVNYLGDFKWTHKLLHHTKDMLTYADTIAPLFIFVVGMGFRLSILRRSQQKGLPTARWESLKRYIILFLVGVAFYGPEARIDWWDALIQIALAGILCLPFMDKSVPVRLGAALFYLVLYNVLYFNWGTIGEYASYAEWMTHRSMNGGPFSPIGYSFALLCGSTAYDLMMTRDNRRILTWSIGATFGLLLAAFVAWWLLPKDDLSYYAEYGRFWTTSKRWSVAPFMLITTGLGFAVFAFFYWLNDMRGITIPTLTIVGMNPLVIYLLQLSLLSQYGTYLPEDAPHWAAIPGVIGCYGVCYAVAWRLWKDKTIIKL